MNQQSTALPPEGGEEKHPSYTRYQHWQVDRLDYLQKLVRAWVREADANGDIERCLSIIEHLGHEGRYICKTPDGRKLVISGCRQSGEIPGSLKVQLGQLDPVVQMGRVREDRIWLPGRWIDTMRGYAVLAQDARDKVVEVSQAETLRQAGRLATRMLLDREL